MFKYVYTNKRGFSLIEVITVLFVISLGLIGVLSLIVQNVQSQSLNKNNLIAYQLAQEGVELIRGVRDSNWEASLDWDVGMTAANETYAMDYADTAPSVLVGDDSLYLDSNGFYVHSSGGNTDSGFDRNIVILNPGDGTLDLLVHVTWFDHDKTFDYLLETVLYEWK